MKKNSLKIGVGLFLLIGFTLISAIKLYNKPHLNIKKAQPDFFITTQHLVNEYLQDELLADRKYADKVIEVKGKIETITTLKGNSVIALKAPSLESSIVCYLIPEENIKILKLKKGQLISIKGICKGYLLDINMVKCIIINQ